jgi:hypothetical protein
LQYRLVHLEEVLSIDVVLSEYLFAVAAVDTSQPVADLFLIPVLCRLRSVDIGEF